MANETKRSDGSVAEETSAFGQRVKGAVKDGVGAVTGNESLELTGTDALYNPFAAVPSMHVGLAMIVFWSIALLASNRVVKGLLFAYPLLMTYVVVASGNHYWLDAVFGAVTAALAAGAATLVARRRPEWAFGAELPPQPATSAADPKREPEAATA